MDTCSSRKEGSYAEDDIVDTENAAYYAAGSLAHAESDDYYDIHPPGIQSNGGAVQWVPRESWFPLAGGPLPSQPRQSPPVSARFKAEMRAATQDTSNGFGMGKVE